MSYYVFRKSTTSDAMKNCVKYSSLEEAKYAAQDEEYYRSHANSQAERDAWKVILAAANEDWSDTTKDSYEYEEIDYNN